MLLDGTIGGSEVQALETDRRLGNKYRRLRSCDEALNVLVGRSRPVANQGDDSSADAAPQKLPHQLYIDYLHCASGALCEKPLHQWAACVQSLQTKDKEIGHCAQAKRMLERCMRSKVEELLVASQPQIFRPKATP